MPVKREDVQVLHDKLRSTGAHKGVVVAASGFQSGALAYAKAHGIACVRLVDGAWTYEARNLAPVLPQPTGQYVAYEDSPRRRRSSPVVVGGVRVVDALDGHVGHARRGRGSSRPSSAGLFWLVRSLAVPSGR